MKFQLDSEMLDIALQKYATDPKLSETMMVSHCTARCSVLGAVVWSGLRCSARCLVRCSVRRYTVFGTVLDTVSVRCGMGVGLVVLRHATPRTETLHSTH